MTTSESDVGERLEDAPLPPGPDGIPVAGNTVQFVRDPFEFYDGLAEYGDVVSYSVAGEEFCTLLHPDHVEQVLVTDEASFGKSEFVQDAGDFLGNGLLLSEGDHWRKQRTRMQPAFFRERIESYADGMADFAAERAAAWDDGDTVRVLPEMKELTLAILARSLFDEDVRGRSSAIRDATRAINDKADAGSVDAFLPDWVPTPTNRRFRRAVDDFDDVIADLIAQRRGADAADERDDFLAILLTATDDDGETMSESDLRDELATFLFAGHETTSVALTYAWHCLSENPDVREKLHAELADVLGGDRPTMADLPDLEYTETVIQETLRRYPPAYVVFRETREDVEIGGYRVPEGTTLTLPQFEIHNDERWFDDPEAFRPERWTESMEESLPDYAYFPFGGGPRHCIGMRFAYAELQLVLATVAQRVALDRVDDGPLDLRMGTTLEPEGDVEMVVTER
jgi:cytochrome P450